MPLFFIYHYFTVQDFGLINSLFIIFSVESLILKLSENPLGVL